MKKVIFSPPFTTFPFCRKKFFWPPLGYQKPNDIKTQKEKMKIIYLAKQFDSGACDSGVVVLASMVRFGG